MVVGAYSWGESPPTNRGGAFVFERGESGWQEVTFLERSNAKSNDLLGKAVAVRDDLIILGAPGFLSSQGAAHVYRRVGGEWVGDDFSFYIQGGAKWDSFGDSVAIWDENTVIVGAPGMGEGGTDRGSVHVYAWELVFENYDWVHKQKLTASDGEDGDNFGHRMAIDGDTLVVTAPLNHVDGRRSGAAYVFRREEGEWEEKQKIYPTWSQSEPQFGQSVDIDGDVIVVGAPRWVSDDQPSVGTAFVFRWDGEQWEGEPGVGSPEPKVFGFFGISCGASGDRIIVGEDDDTNQTPGKAYVYERPESYWWLAETLAPSDGAAGDRFGIACAIEGTMAVVGADSDEEETGAVYLYELAAPPPPPSVDPVEGFLLPKKMELAPHESAKKAVPGSFSAAGTADLGPDALDLTGPGELTVGTRTFPVPGLTAARNGKVYAHTGGDLEIQLRPAGSGSSLAKFKLSVTGLLPGDAHPDGELHLGYSVGGRDLACRVRLVDGSFRLGRTGSFLEPGLCPTKLKGKLRGDGRDALKLLAGLATGGTVPDPVPAVTLRIGGVFEATLPAAELRRKGERLIFRGDAGGVRKAVLDFAKGRIALVLRRIDLGQPAEGPVPYRVEVGLGTDLRAVEFLVVRKGSSLRY
jgi:hypothetical protein